MAPQHWHDLSEDEKRAIRDTSDSPDFDYPIISVIDGLSREEQQQVYECLAADPDLCKDYNRLQNRWLKTEKDYLALKLQKHPNEIRESEFLSDMENHRLCFRYKLYYLARKIAEGKLTSIMIRPHRDSGIKMRTARAFIEDIISATSSASSIPSDTRSTSSLTFHQYVAQPELERLYPAVCPVLSSRGVA